MSHETAALAVQTDDEGYLVDPDQWSETVAEALARKENIVLTDAHWAVIRFVRENFAERRIIPDARFVLKHLAETRGLDRNALFRLFPYGYVKQACKIAGMRKPRAWSTG